MAAGLMEEKDNDSPCSTRSRRDCTTGTDATTKKSSPAVNSDRLLANTRKSAAPGRNVKREKAKSGKLRIKKAELRSQKRHSSPAVDCLSCFLINNS
jgi:hypothetical protein